jgi:tripartite-type tricarboxylate transporter receptor subunit TctC
MVSKLNAEIASVLRQPESAQRLEAEGAEPRPLSSAEFARLIAAALDKWTRVARESNIRAE